MTAHHDTTADYAEDIQAKAQQLGQLLDENDIDIEDRNVLIGSDMNGPLASTASADLPVHPGVRDAFHDLDLDRDDRMGAIISGYDLHTLRNFRDGRLGLTELELVGELGSVYEIGDQTSLTAPDEPEDDLIEAYHSLYKHAAQSQMKLLLQGNSSNVVGCVKVEAEGTPDDPRAEIYQRFDVDPSIDTASIWEQVKDHESFEYDEENDRIRFEPGIEPSRQLKSVLTNGHAYAGVRFEEDGEKIVCYRDREDSDIDLEDAHRFIEQALHDTSVQYDHNPDWGSDFVREGTEVSKERGANQLAQDYFQTEDKDDYLILHVGDKESDVMTGDNTVFFAQEGRQAEQYCKEHDIPHITVKDGAEYAQVVNHYLEEIA